MADNLDRYRGPNGQTRYVAYDSQGFAFRCERQRGATRRNPAWIAWPSYAGGRSDPRRLYAPSLASLAARVGESSPCCD